MAFNIRAPGISQAGIAGVGAFTDLMIGGIQADMEEASQAYSNTMRQISAAQQTNAVVRSEAQQEVPARQGTARSKRSSSRRGRGQCVSGHAWSAAFCYERTRRTNA